MTSITIITIVVVALLTVIIFGLAWLGWSSCIKSYKMEVSQGKYDDAILKEYHSKKSKSGLVGIICSYLALTILAGLFITGVVYKARGENLAIGNQTALVIKTGSMSDYYDKDLADKHPEYKISQFDIGDICIFETNFNDLVEGEVYGYKYKDIIITHRLWKYNRETGCCEFRGDNNFYPENISDVAYYGTVYREDIVYHYTGKKIPCIGAFILYAQSIFGIWSLAGIIGVAVSSEIVYYQINKINKARDNIIYKPEEKPIEEVEQEEKPKKKLKAKFKRRDGTLVEIYAKEPTAEAPSKTHEEKEGAEDEK